MFVTTIITTTTIIVIITTVIITITIIIIIITISKCYLQKRRAMQRNSMSRIRQVMP